MPVLFNFVRKKREGGEGEERKTEERKREREKFQVCDYTTKSVAWKEAKRDTWRRGYLENLALQISFYSTLKKGEKARGKRKGTKRW